MEIVIKADKKRIDTFLGCNIETELMERIVKLCAAKGVSKSSLIRQLMDSYLKQEGF